jgi:hypothetical protein
MINIHIILVILTLLVVIYSDHKAFLWFLGRISNMDKTKTTLCHNLALWGFLLISITGFYLFLPMREFLLANNFFVTKMAFVAVLGINGLFIGILSKNAIQHSFLELNRTKKIILLFSGFVSTFSWIMAIILAYMIF